MANSPLTMQYFSFMTWLRASKCLLVVCGTLLPFFPVHAQEVTPSFLFRPHCEEGDGFGGGLGGIPNIPPIINPGTGNCFDYPIRDPQTRETEVLSTGDILDVDLYVDNADGLSFQRVRAWIVYDPNVLEGVRIDLAPDFSLPTPGENDFFPNEGYVKIGASAAGELSGGKTVVARIQFRVLDVSVGSTVLSFFDAQSGADSRTGVFVGVPGTETNLLSLDPSQLFVRLNAGAEAFVTDTDEDLSSGDLSDSAPPVEDSPEPIPEVPEIFTLLQVQNLRATTEGSAVFLTWDPLPSAKLIGHNVYYGTVSSQYTQRRSLDAATHSTTIRNLPVGSAYYFAVRGVNGSNEETAYSQEVAVSVSNPGSSTAPLQGQLPQGQLPQGTGKSPSLSGSTGMPSSLTLLLVASTIVGMTFAFRRQFFVVHSS